MPHAITFEGANFWSLLPDECATPFSSDDIICITLTESNSGSFGDPDYIETTPLVPCHTKSGRGRGVSHRRRKSILGRGVSTSLHSVSDVPTALQSGGDIPVDGAQF